MRMPDTTELITAAATVAVGLLTLLGVGRSARTAERKARADSLAVAARFWMESAEKLEAQRAETAARLTALEERAADHTAQIHDLEAKLSAAVAHIRTLTSAWPPGEPMPQMPEELKKLVGRPK